MKLAGLVPGGRVLDVGCAEGFVCKRLKDMGFEAYGVEPHPDMVRYAKEKLGLGYVTHGVYGKDLYPERFFDGIVMSHVLEHVFDVRGFISALWWHLKPDGVLVIEVPCLEIPIDAFNNDHFTVWSRTGLGNVFDDQRFEIVGLISVPADLQIRVVTHDETASPLRPGTMCVIVRRRQGATEGM